MPWPGRAHWGTRERCTFWADLHLALPFPQVALFKGANLPKPVHCTHPAYAPLRPRPQMPNRTKNRLIYLPLPYFRRSLSPKNPNLPIFCTLPTKNKHQRGRVRPPSNGLQLIDLNHSTRPTHQPRQAPPHKLFSVQKPGRFAPQPPVSPAHATQKPKSADFLYFPHQKQAPTGQSAPVPPPRHRSPPRLTATAEQSANYRLSGNSTVTRHPSPSLRTLTVP